MTVQCQGCGTSLSDSFVRVFYTDEEQVTACPNCSDTVKNGFRPPEAPDKLKGL